MSRALDAAGHACLFAAHPRAGALRALYQWCGVIDELVASGRTRSHEAAHHKLQWWQAELQRLNAGKPAHPLTRELHSIAPEPGLWSELPERLELAVMELAGVAPDDQAAAERWDWRRHGAVQWTALRLLAPEATAAGGDAAADLRRFAQQLGVGLGRLDACTSPLQQSRKGRLGLPLEGLEAHGIALHELPEALGATAHSRGLATLVLEQLTLAENALLLAKQQWQGLNPNLRSALRHTAVRLALAYRATQRLKQQPLTPNADALLPPWRTLWAAWHAARRAHH
jgi:phytoene/squalene synthetase